MYPPSSVLPRRKNTKKEKKEIKKVQRKVKAVAVSTIKKVSPELVGTKAMSPAVNNAMKEIQKRARAIRAGMR